METLGDGVRWVHVAFGFLGLALFWVPIFTRKGQRVHRLFGKGFYWCALVVTASAFLAVLLLWSRYLGRGLTPAENSAAFGSLLFLGYLAVVTFIIVRHGVGVLQTKGSPEALGTPLNVALARIAIAASLVLIAYVAWYRPSNLIILLALSPIGLTSGLGMLRYLRGAYSSPRQWLYEHLGSMIGAGIAFHTAFAVFGANRMFDLPMDGWVAVVPWVLPAAVGIPASALWTRHYRKKFGELNAPASPA